MKKYHPFLTIGLLIAGVFLCINFRTIKMVWFMSSRFMVPDSPLSMDRTAAFDLNKLKLSPEDRAFVEGYLQHRDFAWYKSMSEKYPDDKVFLTTYILELLREPEKIVPNSFLCWRNSNSLIRIMRCHITDKPRSFSIWHWKQNS